MGASNIVCQFAEIWGVVHPVMTRITVTSEAIKSVVSNRPITMNRRGDPAAKSRSRLRLLCTPSPAAKDERRIRDHVSLGAMFGGSPSDDASFSGSSDAMGDTCIEPGVDFTGKTLAVQQHCGALPQSRRRSRGRVGVRALSVANGDRRGHSDRLAGLRDRSIIRLVYWVIR